MKPILELIAQGKPINLDLGQREVLTEYLFYKILILDADFEAFSTPEVAQAFYEARTIPDDVSLYILNCVEGSWRSGIRIMGGHFAAEVPDLKAPPNVRTIALGFGNLFVYAVLRKGGVFDPVFAPGIAIRLLPIFHPTTLWPPPIPITSDRAETIAMAIWHGGNPSDEEDFSGFPVFGSMIKA